MEELVVSSEYVSTLSKQMRTWQSEELESAIAAVPADWTAAGISITAIGGAAVIGGAVVGVAFGKKLSAKWDTLMAKDFSIKKFSFTGQEAYNIAQMANAGYTIYLQLSSGDYWGASLTVVGLIPSVVEIRNIRSGFAKTIEAAGAVTKILEYTAYGLQGMDLCFGPATALGNVSGGLGIDSDAGEVFTAGAKQFVEAGEKLQNLMPDSRWTGTAATAYAEDVQELKTLMDDMAAADNGVAAVLALEMDQLQLTHNLIGTASTAISLAIPAALALYTIPVTGPEMSQALQIAVSFGASVTAIVAMANQLNLSHHNGKKMDVEAERYRAAKTMADALYSSLVTPSTGTGTQPTGSAGVSGSPVVAGAAGRHAAQTSTAAAGSDGPVVTGAAVSTGPVAPSEFSSTPSAPSFGPVGVVAAGGAGGGMSMAGSGRTSSGGTSSGGSSPGGASALSGARPRHAALDPPGEQTTADEPGATGAGAGPGAHAAVERAPVDAAVAAPEEPREGSTV